jgi:hypothetical protein
MRILDARGERAKKKCHKRPNMKGMLEIVQI